MVFLCFATNALAQTEDTGPVDLERIVVTASRSPENSKDTTRETDIVTRQDIERSGAKELSQVLSEVPGLQIIDYGGLGASKTVHMRGSTASQVLVLMDGRPLNSPRDGETDLSRIPLADVERIEIVHGPASSLYGQGAMGGVINIITKAIPRNAAETYAVTAFGTFETYLERLSVGAGGERTGALVAGEYKRSAGFRENSDTDSKSANVRLAYDPGKDQNLDFHCGFLRSRSGAPGPIDSPDIDDRQNDLERFFDLTWKAALTGGTDLKIKVYRQEERLDFRENSAGSMWDTAGSVAVHTTRSIGTDAQISKRLTEKLLGVAGGNFVLNTNDSTSSGKHKYTLSAGFLESRWDILDNLAANAGIRVDDYSNFGSQVNPSASFLYGFTDRLRLKGSIGRSFRAPTFNDLYWPDEGWSAGNPNLLPETGLTEDVTIEIEPADFLASSLTYFHSEYHDLINWAPDPLGVWRPTNVNNASINGLELKNRYRMFDHLTLGLDYNFLLAKDLDSHKYLVYQPRHALNGLIKYETDSGLACELRTQWTGTRYHDAANTIKVKDYLTMGLIVSQKVKNSRFFARIDNMLARPYQVVRNYPQPGFSILSGLELEF